MAKNSKKSNNTGIIILIITMAVVLIGGIAFLIGLTTSSKEPKAPEDVTPQVSVETQTQELEETVVPETTEKNGDATPAPEGDTKEVGIISVGEDGKEKVHTESQTLSKETMGETFQITEETNEEIVHGN